MWFASVALCCAEAVPHKPVHVGALAELGAGGSLHCLYHPIVPYVWPPHTVRYLTVACLSCLQLQAECKTAGVAIHATMCQAESTTGG